MSEEIRYTYRMSQDAHTRLKVATAQRGFRTIQELIDRALSQYLASPQTEKPAAPEGDRLEFLTSELSRISREIEAEVCRLRRGESS